MRNPFLPLTDEELEAFEIIAEQTFSDILVEDSFREALDADREYEGELPVGEGDLPFEEYHALFTDMNTPSVFDLCDIADATIKGYTIG
jgi:hypothetical protein